MADSQRRKNETRSRSVDEVELDWDNSPGIGPPSTTAKSLMAREGRPDLEKSAPEAERDEENPNQANYHEISADSEAPTKMSHVDEGARGVAKQRDWPL